MLYILLLEPLLFGASSTDHEASFDSESITLQLTESTGEPTAKRFKCGEGDNGNNLKAEHSTSDHSGESSPLESTRDDGPPKPPERHPKQDYIHVRARRGQATDSHSLAERVIIMITISPIETLQHPLLLSLAARQL